MNQTRRILRPRRGIALMVVLLTVATSAVLAWAMLSAASLKSQVGQNAVATAQARYLAESGASLALHYMANPHLAPSTQIGSDGQPYWPGGTVEPFGVGQGSVDVGIVDVGAGRFEITSGSELPTGGVAEVMTAVRRATPSGFPIKAAFVANGNATLRSNVIIEGLTQSVESIVRNLAQLRGGFVTVEAPEGCDEYVPQEEEVSLLVSTGNRPAGASATQRGYVYNGQVYFADRLPNGTVTGTLLANATTNPANVWYSDSNVVFDGVTLNGTVVVRQEQELEVRGVNSINAKSGMPGVIAGRLNLHATITKRPQLQVDGVVYLNDEIKNSGTSLTGGSLRINGALLASSDRFEIKSEVRTPITVNFDAARATLPNFSTRAASDAGEVSVIDWRLTRQD